MAKKDKGAAPTEADRRKKSLLAPDRGQSLTVPCPWRIPESLLEPVPSTKADPWTLHTAGSQALDSNAPGPPQRSRACKCHVTDGAALLSSGTCSQEDQCSSPGG